MILDPVARRMYQIFMLEQLQRRDAAEAQGRRFVHYTGVDAGVGMLRNSEVWMRKSSVMNDFREIDYGVNCLARVWDQPAGKRFRDVLESMFAGCAAKIDGVLDAAVPAMRFDTFLACISEHDDDEDTLGRLSMWRAYGSIAMVLNPDVFMGTTDALQVYSSPVSYQTLDQFGDTFAAMVERLDHDRHFLIAQGEQVVLSWITLALRQAIICTKHPGFKEEREWRIIYHPQGAPSPFVSKSIEVIAGVAQPVVKLSLHDDAGVGIVGLSPASLINRIIIGPTQFPNVLYEAFATLLGDHGVADAFQRVAVSDIPLRAK